MSNYESSYLTQEQFEHMRKIRKEISQVRQKLNGLAQDTHDGMISRAEEQLAEALDTLNYIEEGDWL